jgi:hypothetical protein
MPMKTPPHPEDFIRTEMERPQFVNLIMLDGG